MENLEHSNKGCVWSEDVPTVRFLRPFSDFQESVDIFTTGSFCVPSFAVEDGKERRHEIEDSL